MSGNTICPVKILSNVVEVNSQAETSKIYGLVSEVLFIDFKSDIAYISEASQGALFFSLIASDAIS